jgi:polar amino acid transport system substrate-binding protein
MQRNNRAINSHLIFFQPVLEPTITFKIQLGHSEPLWHTAAQYRSTPQAEKIMKFGKILISLLLALTFQLTYAADVAVPSPLRIGTSADYPPLTFKQDGAIQGMEADLATAVTEQLQVKSQMVEMPLGELITALHDNKIDVIMAGLSVTYERSKQVLFTKPYMNIGQMGLIREAELLRWSKPRAVYAKGIRIGVKAGTTGEAFAHKSLTDAKITSFTSINEGTDALADKRIDIFIHDAPTIWHLSANSRTQKAGLMGLYRLLTDEDLAWAVRLQDQELANALNKSLSALQANGTLDRLTQKWLPVKVKVKN